MNGPLNEQESRAVARREVLDGQAGTLVRQLQGRAVARVYNDAAQTIGNAAYTQLTFNSETYDRGPASEQHSTTSNTGRLTCRVAGVYSIGAYIPFDANSTGERLARLRLDGSTVIAEDGGVALTSPLGTSIAIQTDYALTAGQYVDVAVYQNSGGDLDVLADAAFFWHWTGP